MAIGNAELLHEYFPKHARMETAKNEKRQKKQKTKVRRDTGTRNEVKPAQKLLFPA